MDRYTQPSPSPTNRCAWEAGAPAESEAVATLQKEPQSPDDLLVSAPGGLASLAGVIPNPDMIIKGVFGPYYLGDEAEEKAISFGPLTEQAVKDFQEEVRIDADGRRG